jgi:hypothetical protein
LVALANPSFSDGSNAVAVVYPIETHPRAAQLLANEVLLALGQVKMSSLEAYG